MKKFFGETVFFGVNPQIAEVVQRHASIHTVVIEKRHYTKELFDFTKYIGAHLIAADSLSELDGLFERTWDVGISCGLGFIFKAEHMSRFKHGIWNVHYGPLPEVRGRHPISWAFLKGLPFGVTVHIVDEEIDRGTILAKDYIEREFNDTQSEIESKIEGRVREGLLERAINTYRDGSGEVASEGVYYPSLVGTYSEIRPQDHDASFVFDLFKSQLVFGGVEVAGKQYLYCRYYNSMYPHDYEGCDIFECAGGDLVALSRDHR